LGRKIFSFVRQGSVGRFYRIMFEEVLSTIECGKELVNWSINLIHTNIFFLEAGDLKRLHVHDIDKKETSQLEFESDITMIGQFDNLIILGDSDGYVCLLDALDPLGKEVLFGPVQLSHSPLISLQENYIRDSNSEWYQLCKLLKEDGVEVFSFLKVSFDPPINYLLKTKVLSWPLESMKVEPPLGQSLLCASSSMISLRREATTVSLVKLAASALSIFNPNRKKTAIPPNPTLITGEIDFEVVEKLNDSGREFSKLELLSEDLIACFDARRAQIFILDPKVFILVKQLKGYRDSLIHSYGNILVLVSNKRKIIEVWKVDKNKVGAWTFTQDGKTKNFDENIHILRLYPDKLALLVETSDIDKSLIKLVKLSV
jgi:hypothetical protein